MPSMSKTPVYYKSDHAASFGGINRLANASVGGRKEAQDFLEGADAYTLFREIKRPRIFRKTIAHGTHDLYQCDLVEIQKIAKYNDGFRYLMFTIDVFSRMLFVVPIRKKTGDEIVRAFKITFKKLKQCKLLHTDRGMEFRNKTVKSFLLKRKIHLYHTYSDKKASLVERVQRTIMQRIWKYFEYARTRRLVEVLPKLVKSYNNSFHRTLGARPVDVSKRNESEFFARLYPSQPRIRKPKFKVGDTVRISKNRHVLLKKYKQSFSDEVFIVDKIKLGTPIVYYLVDRENKEPILGSFYESELQRVRISVNKVWPIEKIIRQRRTAGGKEYLVKWRGYSSSHNSWVKASDIDKSKKKAPL